MTTDFVYRGITLPPAIKEKIDAYVQDHRPVGDFLRAVIENDLWRAVGRADDENLAALPAIVGYLYNECDYKCWGSPEAYRLWSQQRKLVPKTT